MNINPLCKHLNCTTCELSPIEYSENHIFVRIPKYVFKGDKEFAENEGKKLFEHLWNDNPEIRTK